MNKHYGFIFQFNPSSPSESVLDFGTIGMNEKRDMYFALLNKGPVKVVLRGWGGNITGENNLFLKGKNIFFLFYKMFFLLHVSRVVLA